MSNLRWSTLLLGCWLAGLLTAQTAVGPARDDDSSKPAPPGRHTAKEWSESESRRLFAGCDANADDRLDLFEASVALETMGSPRDRDTFRRFDRDRDGYLTLPEFDLHFRQTTQRGDALRVRTCRPMPPARTQARATERSPAQHMLDLFDQDASGDLRDGELDAMLLGLSLPPAFAPILRGLDKNASGGLDETELTAALQALPPALLGNLPGAKAANKATALPAPWGDIDLDRDALIDSTELARSLRQIDPELASWARQILQVADTDRDQRLSAAELEAAMPAGNKAPAQGMVESRTRG
ncbi:MAG: EF-hand domain-containing protein [Planctomycetes bacterium]|nr:EF-hand domain-containing protein [Planctomycetota bacterium]